MLCQVASQQVHWQPVSWTGGHLSARLQCRLLACPPGASQLHCRAIFPAGPVLSLRWPVGLPLSFSDSRRGDIQLVQQLLRRLPLILVTAGPMVTSQLVQGRPLSFLTATSQLGCRAFSMLGPCRLLAGPPGCHTVGPQCSLTWSDGHLSAAPMVASQLDCRVVFQWV